MTVAAGRRMRDLARDPEARRFVRFLLVGGLNTLVGYLLFAGLLLMGAGPTAAVVGATVLGVLFNFGSIGRLVFGRGEARLLPAFVAVYAGQCAANLGLLRLAAAARVPAVLAEAAILPVLAVATFLAMRRFVFARAAGAPAA